MSHNPYESTPGRYVPATAATTSAGDESPSPQNPTSSPKLSKSLSDPSPAKPKPLALACPVPGCPLVFKGEKPHGYLKRHLKRPGVYMRTGDLRATWISLHKIEHDRLVAAGIVPAEREPEENSVRTQKVARLDEFELRARSMGITRKALVAQKVTIWEGMYAAKESGDSINVARRLGSGGFLYKPVEPSANPSVSPSMLTPEELIILREIRIWGFSALVMTSSWPLL
ncbi:hypothetical protein HOY80DRAFT_1110386 [Tuber brumale]|nr:hypothetical protein HOY80DRAFT_1110386 [Tuber brumale]